MLTEKVGEIVTELTSEIPETPDEQTSRPLELLDEIIRGKQTRPRRTLLYGLPKIGKSTFASHAPLPIFVPTEEGTNDIDVDTFPISRTYDEFFSRLGKLQGDHKYQTIVVDSLDWLERLIHAEVCKEKGVSCIEEIGYGKGYKSAMVYWEKVLEGLAFLRDRKKMHVVLIAHSQVTKYENPEGENYDKYMPKLHAKTVTPTIIEWCDEVLFASYKVFTSVTEEGFGKKKVMPASGCDRILRCTEKPYCVAGNRLGMPDEIKLEWSEYAKFFDNSPMASALIW